jgi:ferredoxin
MSVQGVGAKAVITVAGLQGVIDALASRGYQVLGPTLRDGAIVYDSVAGVDDLPRGWTDRQDAGQYRVERRTDGALFGYAVGPQSWKRYLHPPVQRLWEMRRDDGKISDAPVVPEKKFAFLGVRACELHAIAIQDKVFLGGPFIDSAYQARRHDNFFIALNCGVAGGTCFCVSMKTGPRADGGFDLALTELLRESHEFLVEAGSEAGAQLLDGIAHRMAAPADIAAAAAVTANTAASMGRTLDTAGIKELLQENPEHPRWDDVAARCLSCANCTMVCPTCFCTTVEDHTDLTGATANRERKWDSCFTLDFSYIHGGSVRKQTRSRYRQWMTHKLSTWIDQFGSSGCVGCGRCVTWCPVGIDITAEVAAIRAAPRASFEDEHGDD